MNTWTRSLALAACTASVLSGCAFMSALEVQYPEASVRPAMLASVAPRRVVLAPVGDRRADPTRIGLKNKDGAPLLTRRPVTDVVRDALAAELARNGHTLVPTGGDVVVATDVEEFWLDAVSSGGGTLYVGRVAIALSVSDATTGARRFARRYVGIRRQAGEDDSKAVRREVMDAALARAMHDIVTDPELVTAFAPRRSLARAAWRPLP